MKRFYSFLILFSIAGIFLSCEPLEEPNEDDTGGSSTTASAEGYWEKHNKTGYIRISGSTARFCMASSGSEWVGTYNSSNNTIDIDLDDGYTAHFIAQVDGSQMTLIQHFSDGHSTNTAYYATSSSAYPCSGGGSSGSGSGGSSSGGSGSGDGSSSTGSLTIWTNKDHGCGVLKVYVNGSYKGDVTGYYSYGTPECGDAYTVTLNGLSPGSYSVSAKCEDGTAYWDNTSISVSGGACSTFLLN